MAYKHELGKEAKDIVTGFKGIITSRTEYLTGCNRYGLQPKANKEGKTDDPKWFDENQIEIIGKGVVIQQTIEQRTKGGPQPNPKKY